MPQIAEWGEANRPKALEFLHILDEDFAADAFAVGDDFTIADITGLVALDFMKPAKITVPAELTNILRWYRTEVEAERVSLTLSRP